MMTEINNTQIGSTTQASVISSLSEKVRTQDSAENNSKQPIADSNIVENNNVIDEVFLSDVSQDFQQTIEDISSRQIEASSENIDINDVNSFEQAANNIDTLAEQTNQLVNAYAPTSQQLSSQVSQDAATAALVGNTTDIQV